MNAPTCTCTCGRCKYIDGEWREEYAPLMSCEKYCWKCGAQLNDDGTCGPTYAELMNECMKLTNEIFCITRDAHANKCLCLICKFKDLGAKEEPCKRCVGKNSHMSGLCWKSNAMVRLSRAK